MLPAQAITEPLTRFNERHPQDPPVSIEPELVDAVVAGVRADHFLPGFTGQGNVGRPDQQLAAARIKSPYLQLVMSRLWDREMDLDSRELRLGTLAELKGVEQIVRSHLDDTLAALEPADQEIAAGVFRYLVTPSGSKIALTAEDLAEYSGKPQAHLRRVLEALSTSNRILTKVPDAPGQPAERFEIFHDALAPAVLDWRVNYLLRRERTDVSAAYARREKEIVQTLDVTTPLPAGSSQREPAAQLFIEIVIAAGLLATPIATLLLIIAYILSERPFVALLTGVIGLGVPGVVFALLLGKVASVAQANPLAYRALVSRLTHLEVIRLSSYPDLDVDQPRVAYRQGQLVAFREAAQQIASVARQLGVDARSGRETNHVPVTLAWLFGDAYARAWSQLDRAEEALIEVVPLPRVVAWGLDIDLVTRRWRFDHERLPTGILRQAVAALDPAASRYALDASADGSSHTVASIMDEGVAEASEGEARAIVRQFQLTIDSQRGSMLAEHGSRRTTLALATTIMAILGYGLLLVRMYSGDYGGPQLFLMTTCITAGAIAGVLAWVASRVGADEEANWTVDAYLITALAALAGWLGFFIISAFISWLPPAAPSETSRWLSGFFQLALAAGFGVLSTMLLRLLPPPQHAQAAAAPRPRA